MSHGKILFFGLYYVMTGIHALHVIIGISVITFMFAWTLRGEYIEHRLHKTGERRPFLASG